MMTMTMTTITTLNTTSRKKPFIQAIGFWAGLKDRFRAKESGDLEIWVFVCLSVILLLLILRVGWIKNEEEEGKEEKGEKVDR